MTTGVSLDKSLLSGKNALPEAPQGSLGGRVVINTTEQVNALRKKLEDEKGMVRFREILAGVLVITAMVCGAISMAILMPLSLSSALGVGVGYVLMAAYGRCEFYYLRKEISPKLNNLTDSLDATVEFAENHGIKLDSKNLVSTHDLFMRTKFAEQGLQEAQAAV